MKHRKKANASQYVHIAGDVGYVMLRPDVYALVDAEDVPKICNSLWCLTINRGITYVRSADFPRRYLHRELVNVPPDLFVDHINGDPLDNRKTNLRVCTTAENNKNRRAIKGKLKGVRKHRNKYQAAIINDGNYFYLGTFNTREEAAEAYDRACPKYHGIFARPNKARYENSSD